MIKTTSDIDPIQVYFNSDPVPIIADQLQYGGAVDDSVEYQRVQDLITTICDVCSGEADLLLGCSDFNCLGHKKDDSFFNNWAPLAPSDGIEMSFISSQQTVSTSHVKNVGESTKKRTRSVFNKNNKQRGDKIKKKHMDDKRVESVLNEIRKTTSEPEKTIPEHKIWVGQHDRYTIPEFEENSPTNDVEIRYSRCRLDGECPICKKYRITYQSNGSFLECEKCVIYTVMEERDQMRRQLDRLKDKNGYNNNAEISEYGAKNIDKASMNMKTYLIE